MVPFSSCRQHYKDTDKKRPSDLARWCKHCKYYFYGDKIESHLEKCKDGRPTDPKDKIVEVVQRRKKYVSYWYKMNTSTTTEDLLSVFVEDEAIYEFDPTREEKIKVDEILKRFKGVSASHDVR